MAECWSCGAERAQAKFCIVCHVIQPVPEKVDYFDALNLMPSMRLTRVDIDKAFREISKLVHPDRFSKDEPTQRKLALMHSERVNQAYKVIKNEQTRAEHLLELRGMQVAAQTERTEDKMFLLDLLEKQEMIELIKDYDQLMSQKDLSKKRYKGLIQQLEVIFDDDQGTLDEARACLIELRYIRRMLELIESKEEELI